MKKRTLCCKAVHRSVVRSGSDHSQSASKLEQQLCAEVIPSPLQEQLASYVQVRNVKVSASGV